MMQVVIFAGGKGTRLASATKTLPKPLISINSKPLIRHVMDLYPSGSTFLILAGYKWWYLDDYFSADPNTIVVNTGLASPKGVRLQKAYDLLSPTFHLTYADGVGDISPIDVAIYHYRKPYDVTLTAVHPPSRFGALDLFFSRVTRFTEKPQTSSAWINGGFQVVSRSVVREAMAKGEQDWERETLTRLAQEKRVGAYRHKGWWVGVDTPRDVEYLRGRLA